MKEAKRSGWKLWFRRMVLTGMALVLLGIAFIAWVNFSAVRAGQGKLHDRVEEVPEGGVGLVFGCSERVAMGENLTRENLYFKYRMEAAAELWKAGKVKYLLVSGDNRERNYNEPVKMRAALVKKGVPADRIVCDYAGLRTLDSVIRARNVFKVEDVVFISQRFQNERAAYLAEANGMTFTGYNARDVEGKSGMKVKAREVLARVKMWLDVKILHTQPVFPHGDDDDLSGK